jgi:hypothetical protein
MENICIALMKDFKWVSPKRTCSYPYENAVLPNVSDIKDGLQKMIPEKIANGRGMNIWLRSNFTQSQINLIDNLLKEANENNFTVKIENNK